MTKFYISVPATTMLHYMVEASDKNAAMQILKESGSSSGKYLVDSTDAPPDFDSEDIEINIAGAKINT